MGKKEILNDLFWFEHELLKRCDISKDHFHKVKTEQWKSIYDTITEKYADKTKTWKNGLHWANINGYSPKVMNNFLGCYPVDSAAWFYHLPQILAYDTKVYFLIDRGGFWYTGEHFWIFESGIPELVKVLEVLTQTAFLTLGWLDYYLVAKKFQWIMGVNHHDILSCVGEGLDLHYLIEKL